MLSPDLLPGLHRFQVANANGASPPGLFHLSRYESFVEDRDRDGPQLLPTLPVVIDGQIGRTAEIDRYRFTVTESGPVSIELFARRLLSPLHAILRVTDSHDTVVLDVADTAGRDLSVSFLGKEGETYTLSINDIDYAGDRSSVYRIELATGPIDALIPSSDIAEIVAPEGTADISLAAPPVAVRAAFAGDERERSVVVDLPAGSWRVSARSTSASHPLDLDLSILAPDGRELAFADDSAGSVDPVATVAVATAGAHRIVVGGRSARVDSAPPPGGS